MIIMANSLRKNSLNTVLVLFVIFLWFQAWSQSSVVNTVWASTNLAAPPYSNSVTNSTIPISGSSSNNCMEAYASSHPNGTMRLRSYSSECNLVNKPHASTSWLAKLNLIGNNYQAIPLSFNFSLTGNSKIQSYLVDNCLSIASTQFNGWIYSEDMEYKLNSQILYQQSQMVLYNVSGFTDVDASATVELGISLANQQLSVKNIPDNLMKEFIRKYNALNPTEQNLNPLVTEALATNIPLVNWKPYAVELSQETGTLLNLLISLGIVDKLGVEIAPGVEIGLAVNVVFNYNLMRTINITTKDKSIVGAQLQTITATSDCGKSLANLDASNTFKLVSVIIPDDFNNPLVNSDSLFVEWAGVKFKVTRKSETVGTKNMNKDLLQIELSPNPVRNFLSIQVNQKEYIKYIQIYSLAGELIYTKQCDNFSNSVYIQDINLPKGFYIIKVNSKDKIGSKKFIIQ